MAYKFTIDSRNYVFNDLKTLLAKASPFRSGNARRKTSFVII